MTQLPWPQLPHLLLSVTSPMSEQATAAGAGAGASTVASPPSSTPPSPSLPNSITPISAAPPAKIPFRPRKLRKLSPSSAPTPLPPKPLLLRPLPRTLNLDGEIAAALRHLRAADPHLAHVIDSHNPPSFHNSHPPFHSLARSILYQQLAFKAAASIYSRFLALCGGEAAVLPEVVLALTPHQLRQIGVSGRKASYLHDLARKYQNGILSDRAILALDDKSLFTMLTMVKGIGAWSVHMFMIFSLHRPDVLPVGDLGVRKGVQALYGLDEVPRPSQMDQLCDRWRPYRTVGAWYMWRLIEAKGAPNIATTTLGALPLTGGLGGVDAAGHQQQQAQFLDPLQMLPNIG